MYRGMGFLVCAMALGLAVASPGFCAIADGLVGAWLFDEGSGVEAADSSGNGFDGELIGNATWDSNGKFGSAVACDGTEAYVMVPDDDAFEFDGDFTLACWIQNEVLPSDHSSFITKGYHMPGGNGGDSRPWYLVYYLTAGTVDMFLRDEGGTNSRAMGVTAVNDGDWHHITALKDGDEVRIYIDGQQDGTAPAVDAKYGENDQPLVFMVHFQRWFPGLIDEVAIHNRALDEAEINTLMNGLGDAMAVDSASKLTTSWGAVKYGE